MKKLSNISLIKTVMMIIVVLYHSMLFFGYQWFNIVTPKYDGYFLYNIANIFNSFHIQTFTMVSGYLFFYLKSEKNRYNFIKQGIMKKIKRLIVPYIFTSLFWAIPIGYYFYRFNPEFSCNAMKSIIVPIFR